MLKAIKVSLYPSEEQIIHLNKSFGSSRWVYNILLDKQKITYKETSKKLSMSEMGKYLTELKNEYPWLKEVSAKMLQQSMLNLNQGYSNFFKNKKHFNSPVFKSKHSKQSIKFPVDAFRECKGNRINLIKELSNIHFKCSRKDEVYLNKNKSEVRSVTVSKTKSGKYYASILIERKNEKKLKESSSVIGLDLGIKDFIVTSDGSVYENLKIKRNNQQKLKKLNQNLSRKKKGSRNKDRARLKLARYHEKLNNQKEYYLHHVANQLLNENQVIVIEDLNVSGMMKNHKLARSIQELSLNRFKNMLEYKAKWYGREVVKVDRCFPSSKKCSKCGNIKTELTLADRVYECNSCGHKQDRDLNAAINIKAEGRKQIGLNSPELTLVESRSLGHSLKQEKHIIS